MFAQKYKNILSKAQPYLFCHSRNLTQFDLNPLGVEIKQELIFDCVKTSSVDFFDLITKMDQLTFGDQGMGMERWVLYDCSAMPGAIFGFALEASQIEEELKAKMGIAADYQGYIPISMYIAIPTAESNSWFGHNLSSLNGQLTDKLPGLGLLTKALGLATMKITKQYGATQWNNPALYIHTQLSDLELLTTVTPIHTHRYSLTYLAHYSQDSLKEVLAEKALATRAPSFFLDGEDHSKLEQMQEQIEKGARFLLSGRPKKIEKSYSYAIYEEKA